MPLSVTIIISAPSGSGPFDIYSDADGYASPFETGVSKVALEAGYTSTLVPDGASIVRVKSDNVLCSNYIDLSFGTTTTTSTSSTTTTTTEVPTTTTTTTSQDLVQVILYARHDPGASTFPLLSFAYSVDGGSSWTAV